MHSAPRVVFLTDIPTPYINVLLRALSAKVELTCVFCAKNATRSMEWEFRKELGFPYLMAGGFVWRRKNPDGTDYYMSPRILRAIYKSRPDVIISSGYSFPTLYAALYTRLFRKAFLIYSDGTSKSERSLSRIQRLARRLLVPQAAGCIAQSKPAAERFVELGAAGRVYLAPHTADLEPLLRLDREKSSSDKHSLRLLVAGRLIQRKGIDKLLHALAIMPPTKRPVTLNIVGSGPEEENLKDLARRLQLHNVQFSGFAAPEMLPQHYERADVFVFPTLHDPYGIVLLEAAAAGLALVASCHGGATQDLVQDRVTGIVVDPFDKRAFAHRIAELADNPELVARLGRDVRELARKHTAERTADEYVSAINRALEYPFAY